MSEILNTWPLLQPNTDTDGQNSRVHGLDERLHDKKSTAACRQKPD